MFIFAADQVLLDSGVRSLYTERKDGLAGFEAVTVEKRVK